jgi:hypothetical protein
MAAEASQCSLISLAISKLVESLLIHKAVRTHRGKQRKAGAQLEVVWRAEDLQSANLVVIQQSSDALIQSQAEHIVR